MRPIHHQDEPIFAWLTDWDPMEMSPTHHGQQIGFWDDTIRTLWPNISVEVSSLDTLRKTLGRILYLLYASTLSRSLWQSQHLWRHWNHHQYLNGRVRHLRNHIHGAAIVIVCLISAIDSNFQYRTYLHRSKIGLCILTVAFSWSRDFRLSGKLCCLSQVLKRRIF